MDLSVAFLTHYTELYGSNRSLLDLIDGLAGYGVRSSVVGPAEGAISRELARRRIPYAVVPMAWWFQPAHAGGVLPVTKDDGSEPALRNRERNGGRQVLERLRTWQPDVVYTNTAVLADGAVAARKLEVPHVWHLREFGDLDYELEPRGGWARARRLIADATFTVAVSRSVRRHYRWPYDSTRDLVIYNGVASSATFDHLRRRRDAFIEAGGNKDRPFTFALLGMLHPAKGAETALQAFGRMAKHRHDVRLLIVGGGDAAPLRRRIDDLGLARLVELRGFTREPFEVFLRADSALMCSRCEAFGRVTAEAMACGLPVIGHDAGGTPEIVEHEVSGLLYNDGPEALAKCMTRLVEHREMARELGNAGWRIARERFTIERYAQSVHDVLRRAACIAHLRQEPE